MRDILIWIERAAEYLRNYRDGSGAVPWAVDDLLSNMPNIEDAAPQAVNSVTGGAANPRPADAAPAFTQGPAPEHREASKLRSDVDSEDAARYRWLRDQCPYDQRIVIAEMADEGYLLDHHIDKGRCGL